VEFLRENSRLKGWNLSETFVLQLFSILPLRSASFNPPNSKVSANRAQFDEYEHKSYGFQEPQQLNLSSASFSLLEVWIPVWKFSRGF
jgi:hypothetical protein